MLSKYDTLIIINPKVGEEKIKETEEKLKAFLVSNGATLFRYEGIGVQRLATPIKKKNNGYYLLAQYEIDGDKMKAFTQQLKITEPVIRHMHVKLEDILGKDESSETSADGVTATV